eukprot:364754-Chlamydomonas_euryale.AAC.3
MGHDAGGRTSPRGAAAALPHVPRASGDWAAGGAAVQDPAAAAIAKCGAAAASPHSHWVADRKPEQGPGAAATCMRIGVPRFQPMVQSWCALGVLVCAL